MSLLNVLSEALKEAKEGKFDKIELVHEDSDVELYYIQGNQGMGVVRNDLKNELWNIKKNEIQKLKKELNIKKIILKDYQHFGEQARKIIIII